MIDYTGNGGLKVEVNPTIFLIILGIFFAIMIFTIVRTFVRFQKNIND